MTMNDAGDFLISASDADGQSVRLDARIQPKYLHQVDHIIQSRNWPYSTRADLVRHAVHRHLLWMEEEFGEEGLPSVVAQLEVINTTLAEEQQNMRLISSLRDLKQLVDTHAANGDVGAARSLVSRTEHSAHRMPEGFFRDKYLSKSKEMFGYLWSTDMEQRQQAVPMVPVDEDEEREYQGG